MKNKTYCTSCLKSLGVPSRMKIFLFLVENKEATVTEIVDFMKLTQPTVSYHLAEMRKSGIVENKKEGKEVYYSISKICPHAKRVCMLKNINLSKDAKESYVQ